MAQFYHEVRNKSIIWEPGWDACVIFLFKVDRHFGSVDSLPFNQPVMEKRLRKTLCVRNSSEMRGTEDFRKRSDLSIWMTRNCH